MNELFVGYVLLSVILTAMFIAATTNIVSAIRSYRKMKFFEKVSNYLRNRL